MPDKNELHDMLLEMQDYIFSKEMREICNELNSEKENMRQEFYKNVSAARGIYTPVPVIVMLTNDKLGRRVKKKETVLKEGDCFYFDDTGIRIAEWYGCDRKYPLSTEYTFRNNDEEFFFRKNPTGSTSYLGKIWREKDCSISVFAQPKDGSRPFPNAKKNDAFFLKIEIRKFKDNLLSECECNFGDTFKRDELKLKDYVFTYNEDGEIAAYYLKDEPEYSYDIADRYREWIKSRGGLKEVMYF